MEDEKRICKGCGVEFIVKDFRQLYCTRKCMHRAKAKDYYNNPITTIVKIVICKKCGKEFFVKRGTHKRYCSEKCKNERTTKKHTPEAKKNISKARRKFLKENNTNRWSYVQRGEESAPEKAFREILEGVSSHKFYQYYRDDSWDRFFTVDFAELENKIIFEINGNQHYNIDGNLDTYYQKRHNFFVNLGWKVYEIYCHIAFNKEKSLKIIQDAISGIVYDANYNAEVINHKMKRKLEKQKKEKKKYREENT